MAGAPVLHLLSGPNGAGKSALFDAVIGPTTRLVVVNATLIERRQPFVTDTMFSHPSKLDLVRAARAGG